MFFKKKCPKCGAKNPKERVVCIECGAPLASEQLKTQLPHVSTEAEAQVKSTIEKKPEERIGDEYRDDEKALHKAIGSRVHKKSAWFWVGVALLSISALWWLILIPIMIDEPGDTGWVILTGVLFTAIPIGIGIYCVRRGSRLKPVRGVSSEQTFVTHDIETIDIDRERIATKRPVVEKAKETKPTRLKEGMNKGSKPKRYIGQCTNHPDAYAVETCIHCGKIICAECAVFCEEDEEIYCISCMEKLFPETSLT